MSLIGQGMCVDRCIGDMRIVSYENLRLRAFAFQTQGGNARTQSRRLHAEQFCRTSRSGHLAIRLLEGVNNSVSLLTFKFVAREQCEFCGWLNFVAGIFPCLRDWQIEVQGTFLPQDDVAFNDVLELPYVAGPIEEVS